MGNIVYFYLEEFKQAVKYSHSSGVKQVFLDANGSQLCFIDSKLDVYLYDPIHETVFQAPDCPDAVEGVIWDQNLMERTIFAVHNSNTITTYVFVRYHIEGILFDHFLVYIDCTLDIFVKFLLFDLTNSSNANRVKSCKNQ